MKMKIHDMSMKDESCYLVTAVLLTCLLDNTNTVLLTCLDYGTGTIQIGSATGSPPVTLQRTTGTMTDKLIKEFDLHQTPSNYTTDRYQR